MLFEPGLVQRQEVDFDSPTAPKLDEWSDDHSIVEDADDPEMQERVTQKRFDVRWDVGQIIRIAFIGGNATIHRKVKIYCREWERYANIRFQFVSSGPTHARISFYRRDGCDSEIGRNALKVPNPQPTMNLGFPKDANEEEIKAGILHEFGHLLGCSHEHSSPNSGLDWDEEAVYSYYKTRDGWGKRTTQYNVLRKASPIAIATKFDPKSIMCYKIKSSLTKNGFRTDYNTSLSRTDKRFIAEQYPFPRRCGRCLERIDERWEVHFYCKTHEDYLCETCYRSRSSRRQVNDGLCRIRVENDYGRPVVCARCNVGLRKSRDDAKFCRIHENHLCSDCYNSKHAQIRVRHGKCVYGDDKYQREQQHNVTSEIALMALAAFCILFS